MRIALEDQDSIACDGTFFVVPRQFMKLLTFFASANGHMIPVVHCLLTSKKQEFYETIIVRIQQLFPDFVPQRCVTDFEKGLKIPLKRYFYMLI